MRSFLAMIPLALPVLAQNVEAPERFAAARTAIANEVARGATPSIAIAVLEHGETVWAEGFGLADIERERLASADTIYRLASISKPFTATAIMQLCERGLVDLDAPVNRYLEAPLVAYRGSADGITVRRLLNHTAGLPTHWNFFYGDERPPTRAQSIRAYGFAAFEPGTRTNYSNLAFGVLDHVIARLGKHQDGYRGWLLTELLDPLGMTHTDVGVRPGLADLAAIGYRKRDDAWVAVPDYGFDHDGASAIRSSANDLMRFARLQLECGTVDGIRLLDEKSTLAMRERTALDAGSDFAIGWSVGEIRGELALRHSGGMPGVSTQLIVFPKRNAAIAALRNGVHGSVKNSPLDALLDVVIGPSGPSTGSDDFPFASPRRPVLRHRGQIAHPGGPITITLEVDSPSEARLSLRGEEPTAVQIRSGSTGLVFCCQQTVPVGHGDAQGTLEFELEPTQYGYAGVAYATVDGVCRLPFWMELAREEPKPDGTLRVISYNVLVGFQDSEVGRFLPGTQREQKISAWLAAQQPDVVALQEMNGFDHARLLRLAAAWGHGHVAMLKENGYPVALTSSQPITVVDRHLDGLHHGMLHARTHGVDFVVVHFVPSPGVPRKLAECERALACYNEALNSGHEVVVLGDFNSIATTDVPHFSAAARARYEQWRYLVDNDRPGEIAMTPLLDAGAHDVLLRFGYGHDELPLPRIDFVLASPGLAGRCTAARWLCDPRQLRLSDHPPVVADFSNGK